MKIRVANTSDIAALIALNALAHDAHVKAFPDRFRPEIPAPLITDFFAEKLKSPASYYLIAEKEEPIGALRANFLDLEESWHSIARRVCYVAGIVVLPAFRHQGVARALFETLQRESEARGATIELDVWEFNDEAKRVFAKLGFKPVMERMALNPKRNSFGFEVRQ